MQEIEFVREEIISNPKKLPIFLQNPRYTEGFWDCVYGIDTLTPNNDYEAIHYKSYFEDSEVITDATSPYRILGLLLPHLENRKLFDPGCGYHGRPLNVLSVAPFTSQVTGNDINPFFTRNTQQNLSQNKLTHKNYHVFSGWAQEYNFAQKEDAIYIYHSLGVKYLCEFLNCIRKSLLRDPRELFIFYYLPVRREFITKISWLTLKETIGTQSQQVDIYHYHPDNERFLATSVYPPY